MSSGSSSETTPNTPAVEAAGVRHAYGARVALDGVSFTVRRGEAVALVGPSGAGKTTLLRLLAGMLRPASGSILLSGIPLEALGRGKELTSAVGMMQQRLDLVPQLSVRNNVEAGLLGKWGLGRSIAGLFFPLEDAAARQVIARVGLEGRSGERVARLSGGEQQRVALARVLAQDPAVILADEPVSALDPALADDLLSLLVGIARDEGRTLIASLHTPDLAIRHFDRVLGLRAGRVAFDIPATQVSPDMLQSVYEIPPPPEPPEADPEHLPPDWGR